MVHILDVDTGENNSSESDKEDNLVEDGLNEK